MKSVLLDAATIAGLVSIGVGLWWERPSAALIVVGGILFISGAKAARA